eukprot:TRINITY_DN6999_c0_g1_i1.p2 TRINITY_DN6999_c0_g1~~TRINITY_DN6999_c0_g1_i1.p2  ORF type:complete len:199 (+),score=74.79 TRINITY_DN6999_c0_g1_i1:55-597(+)
MALRGDAASRSTVSSSNRARAAIVRKDRPQPAGKWVPSVVPQRAPLGGLDENEGNSHRTLAAKRQAMQYQKPEPPVDGTTLRRQRAVALHERALEKKIANDSAANAIAREFEHKALVRESDMTRLMRNDFADEKVKRRRKGAKGQKFTTNDVALMQSESRYDRSRDLKRHTDIIAYQLRP